MIRLVMRRLLLAVPLVFIVSSLTFVLAELVPGDAASAILGTEATPEQVAALRSEYGLDAPFLVRYWDWLSSAVQGDLGRSIFTGVDVTSELNSRLAVTLSLTVGMGVVCLVVGVGLGVLGAVQRGWIGRCINALSLLGLALPSFWLGLLMIALFAVTLGWLPAVGYVNFADDPRAWALHLILPVAALALTGVTNMAKQTREAIKDTMEQPFVKGLVSSGLSSRSVLFKHVLRNASLPIASLLGYVIVTALAGSVFVEAVFVLPGLGSLAQQATTTSDLAALQGIAVYITILTVVVNLLTDVVSGWLNPKVRAV